MKNSLKLITASLVLFLATPAGNCAALVAVDLDSNDALTRRVEALETQPIGNLHERVADVDKLLADFALTGLSASFLVTCGEIDLGTPMHTLTLLFIRAQNLIPKNSTLAVSLGSQLRRIDYDSQLKDHVIYDYVHSGSISQELEEKVVAPRHLPALKQAEQYMAANLEKLRSIIARNETAPGAAPLPDADASSASASASASSSKS